MTGNFVQWQERSSCNRKFLNVTGNFFLSVSVRGNFFHWQNISSYDRKFLYVTGNFFLKQEISSCGNISSLWYKIATKVRDFWSYLKIATKVRDFCSKLRLRVQGFLARFLPPCPLKSHPAPTMTSTDDYKICCQIIWTINNLKPKSWLSHTENKFSKISASSCTAMR